MELIFICIVFQAIYLNICKLYGGMSCCTLFNYPIDEMPQKNSGLHDAKDRRLKIYNEINNWFLKTFQRGC